MFGCFQEERFYRQSQARWTELSHTAALTVVFADFEAAANGAGSPLEIPIRHDVALAREWAIVCDAPNYSACLLAFEPPGQEGVADRERRFEAIWTVEPAVVRDAARICAAYAARSAPAAIEAYRERLDSAARDANMQDVRSAIALSNRMLGYAVRD